MAAKKATAAKKAPATKSPGTTVAKAEKRPANVPTTPPAQKSPSKLATAQAAYDKAVEDRTAALAALDVAAVNLRAAQT